MKKVIDKLLVHKRNIIAVAFGQVIAALGTLVGVRLITEFVSPSIFGEYKLILAGISLVTGMLIRPLIQFSMREYHDAERDGFLGSFLEKTASFFRAYLAVIVIIITILVKVFHPQLMNNSSLALFLVMMVLILGANVDLNQSLMVTKNWQVSASLIGILRNWLIPTSIVVGFTLIGESVLVILAATVVTLLFIISIQKFVLYRLEYQIKSQHETLDLKNYYHAAVGFGLPLAAVGVLNWVVHESDRFFLSYYHSESAVGIYSAAYGVVSAPFTLIVGSMAQLLYPVMFKASSGRNRENRAEILKGMLLASGAICILGLLIVGLFERQIAWLALGEAYREKASGLLFWIAFGYGLHAISMSFDLSAYGNKKTIDMFIASGLAALTNITLNFLFVPDYAETGAVIATFFSLLLYLVTMAALFYYRELCYLRAAKSVD